jgi:hypothetical protein
MGEMASAGEIKAHDATVGFEQRSVHGEVRGTTAVWLDVDPPLLRAEVEGSKGSLLAELFDL